MSNKSMYFNKPMIIHTIAISIKNDGLCDKHIFPL